MDNSDCTKESICSVCHKIFPAQTNHKFSDTWTKDDTYHWKVCENDGCTVTTTKTKHSGTDDGDCTTPVICECGEIVTAERQNIHMVNGSQMVTAHIPTNVQQQAVQ